MKKVMIAETVFMLLIGTSVFAQPIPEGKTYNALFADGVFMITPPNGFDDIERDEKGAVFINRAKKISFSIRHTSYPEFSEKTNEELMGRFKNNEFQQGFIRGFNDLSTRKVLNHQFRKIGTINVFEITAVDVTNKVNPIRAIIFYNKGVEFNITVGAVTLNDLDANNGLFDEVMRLLNIPD